MSINNNNIATSKMMYGLILIGLALGASGTLTGTGHTADINKLEDKIAATADKLDVVIQREQRLLIETEDQKIRALDDKIQSEISTVTTKFEERDRAKEQLMADFQHLRDQVDDLQRQVAALEEHNKAK